MVSPFVVFVVLVVLVVRVVVVWIAVVFFMVKAPFVFVLFLS